MSEFTKGPWISKEESGAFDIESDNLLIGVVLGVDLDHTGFNVCNECQANAHLIAAAPDMYGMLESLSEQLTDINAHQAVNEIEALLAKARGEL